MFDKKVKMPSREEALKGRAEKMQVPVVVTFSGCPGDCRSCACRSAPPPRS